MSFDERFRVAAPQTIHQTIDGEVILVHLWRGTYHSLRGSGALLFDAIARGASVGDLAALLAATTDGDATAIDGAVAELVAALLREDLIAPGAEAVSFALPVTVEKGCFEPPVLETFTDLQDLLNADPVHDVDEAGWPHLAREP